MSRLASLIVIGVREGRLLAIHYLDWSSMTVPAANVHPSPSSIRSPRKSPRTMDEDDSHILNIDKEGGDAGASVGAREERVEEHLLIKEGFDGRKVWLVKV